MTTRRKEKDQIKNKKIQEIKETARARAWGRDANDDGHWGRRAPNCISYTRREKKKLKIKEQKNENYWRDNSRKSHLEDES